MRKKPTQERSRIMVEALVDAAALTIALAVTKGLTVADMAHTFSIYPSLSGSITEAGRRLMGTDDLA